MRDIFTTSAPDLIDHKLEPEDPLLHHYTLHLWSKVDFPTAEPLAAGNVSLKISLIELPLEVSKLAGTDESPQTPYTIHETKKGKKERPTNHTKLRM